MFTKILVPLDGSELSERALAYAGQLAGNNGRLMLVRATLSHRRLGVSEMQAQDEAIGEAESYLVNMTELLASGQIDADWRVYYGQAADGILEEAQLHHADSIVMSSHGRTGMSRLLFGSIAEQVLHRTQVPLLLIPARSHTSWQAEGTKRIVVPLDGSAGSEAALEPAMLLARRLSASLYLLAVVEPVTMGLLGEQVYFPGQMEGKAEQARPYLEGVAARVRARGLQVRAESDLGFPATSIAALARDQQTAAVVMASHARAGFAQVALGSVAASLVRHSMAPLLVVRPVAWQRAKEVGKVAVPSVALA